MSRDSFLYYVNAAWLADGDLLEVKELSMDDITKAIKLYERLDKEMYSFRVADYSKKDFFVMSNKLDRRVRTCK